ncbi:MAG: cyclic nucleotide-binding domain-containing protein [FCB group bacterium]|nr:cyclic nucleotide-binding domain-containing protein [FCB group bacterium]
MTYLEKQIIRHFNPGDIIFKEDDPGTSMFIIQKGQVEVFKINNGQKVVLATLKEGSVFGEMSLIDGRPRSASVQAKTACACLEMNQILFKKRLGEVPAWMKSFFLILVDRLRNADQSQGADNPTVLGRRIVFLLEYMLKTIEPDSDNRKTILWKETAETIAMLMNLPEVKINRALNKLALTEVARSEINYEKGKLLIVEKPELFSRYAAYCKEQFLKETGNPLITEFETMPKEELAVLNCIQTMLKQQASANDFPESYFDEQFKTILGRPVEDFEYIIKKFKKQGILKAKMTSDSEKLLEVDRDLLAVKLGAGNEMELFHKLEKRLAIQ